MTGSVIYEVLRRMSETEATRFPYFTDREPQTHCECEGFVVSHGAGFYKRTPKGTKAVLHEESIREATQVQRPANRR